MMILSDPIGHLCNLGLLYIDLCKIENGIGWKLHKISDAWLWHELWSLGTVVRKQSNTQPVCSLNDQCPHTHSCHLIYHSAQPLGISGNPVTEGSELWEVPCGLQLSGPHMMHGCPALEPVWPGIIRVHDQELCRVSHTSLKCPWKNGCMRWDLENDGFGDLKM
jgi:hypothetical protein